MKEVLLLAIDLGTSFIKAGVYGTDSKCVATASEPVKDYRPSPGVFIQKGEELFESVINCVKLITCELGERAKNIEAISFTGQMSGFMGVDEQWNDITTWSCSLDNRYMPYAERQLKNLGDKFLEIGGTNFPQMAPKYEWFKNEFPDESKKIAKYLMISGYVIGRLGDLPIEDAIIDRSYSVWTGLSDVNKEQWSDDICGEIGLDKKYLPKIVASNYICGHLCEKYAKQAGLKSGIPLVSGTGDKSAGCLGAAVVDLGATIFEASSYGMISVCVDEYRPDTQEKRLDVMPSAIPGEFYMAHFVAGSGISIDWFMNNFVRREGVSTADMFDQMDKDIDKIPPGSDGVMALGLLGGSSMPLDGDLRGLWMGFDWSHNKAHFYRALIESFTYDFTLCIRAAERLYPEYTVDDIRIVGGGAKAPVWTQMCADAQNKHYYTLNRSDVAMWGASIIAGNAVGVFPDMKKTAKEFVKTEKKYVPVSAMTQKYQPYIELYKNYTVELHDFFKRLQNLKDKN